MRLRIPAGVFSVVLALLLSAPAASADSFSLGVAAGDVTSNSAVLWGRADQAGTVRLEVATDQAFTRIVRNLRMQASPENDLTVQRHVGDLRPGTRYWYRFTSGATASEVGTFVTAPQPNDDATIRFAWTGDYDA